MEGLQQRFYINHIFQAPTFISQEINAKNDYILTLKKGDREPITLEYISKYSLVKSCWRESFGKETHYRFDISR